MATSGESQGEGTPSPEGRSIFRAEALAHRAAAAGPGDVVRIAPRWTSWAFYALLALLVAALVAMSLVKIDRYATGTTATDDAGRLVVLVPAALASDVEPGSPVDLGAGTATVASAEQAILYPAEVRERFGVDVAVPSIALVTTATGGSGAGSARVLVESEPVIVALIPGLKSLVGGDDA